MHKEPFYMIKYKIGVTKTSLLPISLRKLAMDIMSGITSMIFCADLFLKKNLKLAQSTLFS